MKSGFITLILALIISAIGIAIAINSLIITNQNNKNNIVKEDSLKSQKIAESCLELVFDKLIQNQFYSGDETLMIQGEECRIYSIYKKSNKRIVQIEAGSPNYKKYMEAEITQIAPNLKIKYKKNITNLSNGDINTSSFNSNNPYLIQNQNLKLWLKADSININNNIGVTNWTDYSSDQETPISFSQSTDINQPKFIEYNENFLPTVKFDGIDDFMSAGDIDLYDIGGMSIFIVGKSETTAPNQSYITKFSQIDNKMEWKFQNDNFAIASANNIFNSPADITSFPVETNYQLFTGIWDANNPIQTYINSTFIPNNPPTSNSATSTIASIVSTDTKLIIGALENGSSGFLEGEISEIIVYNKALGTSERQRVENYLNTKYEIY